MMLDHALRLHGAGLSTIPLKPRDKRPDVEWLLFQKERATQEQVRAWWTEQPERNIGVVCGAVSGGLVTLDFDAQEAFNQYVEKFPELMSTRIHLSGSGKGYHVFYYVSDIPHSKMYALSFGRIEVKSSGTQVVFPPSIHPSGRAYSVWHKDRTMRVPDIAPVVEWLEGMKAEIDNARFVQELKGLHRHSGATAHTSKYASGALKAECERVRGAGQGERNIALNRAAFRMGQFVGEGLLSEADVESELASAAESLVREDGAHAVRATILSGLKAGRTMLRAGTVQDGLKRLQRNLGHA